MLLCEWFQFSLASSRLTFIIKSRSIRIKSFASMGVMILISVVTICSWRFSMFCFKSEFPASLSEAYVSYTHLIQRTFFTSFCSRRQLFTSLRIKWKISSAVRYFPITHIFAPSCRYYALFYSKETRRLPVIANKIVSYVLMACEIAAVNQHLGESKATSSSEH